LQVLGLSWRESLNGLRVSRTFLHQLRPQLFRPWIRNSKRCQHFLSSLGPFPVSGCVNSAFLDISQHFTGHLFRPWIPSPARGIDGGPQRSTEIVLNDQSL